MKPRETQLAQMHRAAKASQRHTQALHEVLNRRDATLASTKQRLLGEITRRKTVAAELAKSLKHYQTLLAQSRRMHEQMRSLARQVLSAQEEERREISRELHDEIAQTLAGISMQLAGLKEAAALNTHGLNRKIAATQRLVERSVDTVHRFARGLRPALLDDLGLIPALRSYLKALKDRHELRIHFTATADVETLVGAKRLVFYRVAQEALTNVIRHAEAKTINLHVTKVPGGIQMEVTDDGKSFQPDRIFASKKNKRIGLLGMRERVEMVGGRLVIESVPGKGTTVRAEIPFNRKARE